MIATDALDVELLAEKLLTDAYRLRDAPDFSTLAEVLETTARIGIYLKGREEAFDWADRHLFP